MPSPAERLAQLQLSFGGRRWSPVVVSVMFVIFTGGAWMGVGPVVTTVAVSALPLLVLVVLDRRTAWRPALPWLRVGRLDRRVWALAAATVLVAVVALTLFAALVRPEVSPYLLALRSVPPWLAMAATWGFGLGVIRRRTGGLVVPYLVHVTANLTIGALAVVLLR